jgi:hypothetical protein
LLSDGLERLCFLDNCDFVVDVVCFEIIDLIGFEFEFEG